MSDEENKEKKELEEDVSEGFAPIDNFLDKGEEELKEKEAEVKEIIGVEEEKIEEIEEEKEAIEEKKQEIEARKKEIEEKLKQEREKVEKLKKAEEELKEAEEETSEIREDIKEKKAGISESVAKIKGIFKSSKAKTSSGDGKEKNFFKSLYEDNYKKLLIIPFLMLLLAVAQIAYQFNTTGDFTNRGVDLKGGITLTLSEKTYDAFDLEQMLNADIEGDISVRKLSQTKGLLIEASDISEEALLEKVEEIFGELDPERDYSLEQMGSSLGSSFFREIIRAIIIAFLLMAVVVFITFRVPAPCLAVILAALSDIIVTLAIFNLTGAKLGKGGIAAFLMLIGYSVDTDILLSTKVLKRKFGTVMDRVYSAMKTGLTMNGTTIVAISVAIIFTQSEVIKQIMTILLIGLFVDIINTWIQNVGVLRLYIERKERAK